MRTDILDRTASLLNMYSVKGFVIPANTGHSAKAVLDAFGTGYQYILVGNPVSSRAKGYVHHAGMSEETRKEFSELGMDVVLHEHSCFSQKKPSEAFWRYNADFERSLCKRLGLDSLEIKGTSLSAIVEHTARSFFDQGFKTAVEMALLAGGCPQADSRAFYVSFAFPSRWSDMRDVAIVSRVGTPTSFFTNGIDIQAVLFSNQPTKQNCSPSSPGDG